MTSSMLEQRETSHLWSLMSFSLFRTYSSYTILQEVESWVMCPYSRITVGAEQNKDYYRWLESKILVLVLISRRQNLLESSWFIPPHHVWPTQKIKNKHLYKKNIYISKWDIFREAQNYWTINVIVTELPSFVAQVHVHMRAYPRHNKIYCTTNHLTQKAGVVIYFKRISLEQFFP